MDNQQVDADEEAKYANDEFVEEEEEEQSRMSTSGGRYITDAMMLKCATNAKTKDKKELLKREGRSVFFAQMTHINLERQKLVSLEIDEEVAAREKAKTGLPEQGIRACKKLEVLYLFENRISKFSESMLNFSKLTRLYIYDNCITKMENLENLVSL